MAYYYEGVQFVTADDLDFITVSSLDLIDSGRQDLLDADDLDLIALDEDRFYVDAKGYFEDAENRQLNLNTISFGAYTFSGNKIRSLKLHHESGLLTDQLAIDTMTAVVRSDTKPTLSRYAPVTVMRSGQVLGVYFDGQVKAAGYKQYSIYAESYVSLLDYNDHPGDIYSGANCGDIIAEIMGDIPYTIHPDIVALKLYGYLPYASKRSNLLQILIATGAAIEKNTNGTMHITVLTDTVKGTFGDNRSFIDGNIDDDTQVTAVQVTEHIYVAIDDEITLFTESFMDIRTAKFTEPVHDLSIVNGTILESGANYAVIQGAGAVVLTGQKYRHTTQIVTRGDVLGTPADKILTVTDATMITPLNSSAVAQRLYAYASCSRSVKTDVLVNSERSGDMVQLVNPYGDDYLSAAVHSLDLNLSNTLRASGEFLVDYVPQGVSGGYQHRVVLTGTGSFTIPATEYRAILISGGQGGQAGFNGEDGQLGGFVWDDDETVYDGGPGGDGGNAGIQGAGARILDITLTGTIGDTISYSCGLGGDGGATDGAAGEPGEETILGAHSTSSGSVRADGYTDIFTGELYAIPGAAGHDGEKGGNGAQTGTGSPGNDTDTANGGSGGDGISLTYDKAGGGGGGGASHMGTGQDGSDAGIISDTMYSGQGGDGGSYLYAPDAVKGNGGNGGNGGGGGGGVGGFRENDNNHHYDHGRWGPGIGGTGGPGGPGGPGLIIIYY